MENIYLENVASLFAGSIRNSLQKLKNDKYLNKISPNIDEIKKEIDEKFDFEEELKKIEHFEQLFLSRIGNKLYSSERLLITLTSNIVFDIVESCKLTRLIKLLTYFNLIDLYAVYIDEDNVLVTEISNSTLDINDLLPNIEYSIL